MIISIEKDVYENLVAVLSKAKALVDGLVPEPGLESTQRWELSQEVHKAEAALSETTVEILLIGTSIQTMELYNAAVDFVDEDRLDMGGGGRMRLTEAVGAIRNTGLKVFQMGPDTVIAKDIEDAWVVLLDHYGSGSSKEDFADYWEELAPEKELTIWTDDFNSSGCDCATWTLPDLRGKDMHPNGHHRSCPRGSSRMTASCWAIIHGRGFLSFLASTEF